jgi:hypothetical protein
MEGSLTVPSFIELGHAQAIPFRLTFHLVSAGSDQPPPDGLMDSFKPTVMVTLARQMSAGPCSRLVYGPKAYLQPQDRSFRKAGPRVLSRRSYETGSMRLKETSGR